MAGGRARHPFALPEPAGTYRARHLRNQFRRWPPAPESGFAGAGRRPEIDIGAYLQFAASTGTCPVAASRRAMTLLPRAAPGSARDLACLLVADLPLSTDTYRRRSSARYRRGTRAVFL